MIPPYIWVEVRLDAGGGWFPAVYLGVIDGVYAFWVKGLQRVVDYREAKARLVPWAFKYLSLFYL